MWLLDQWAERHILDAQKKGEFEHLPGNGKPLVLDDDSHVPPELRAGFRLLKNAGCLPPETLNIVKKHSLCQTYWLIYTRIIRIIMK